MDKKQNKVRKVMREFKEGKLKSSSGQKVTNPKQAIAIGLSEAGLSKRMAAGGSLKDVDTEKNPGLAKLPEDVRNKMGYAKKGGMMKESKAMMKKEISFMKKKGAPASMVKHEEAEAKGMKYGGKTKKMAAGGMTACKTVAKKEVKAHEKRMHKMAAGGKAGQLSKADGVATKGKSKGTMITMRKGGYC